MFFPYSFAVRNAGSLLIFLISLVVIMNGGVDSTQAQDPEVVSWKIKFEGNETFSNIVLRDIIATSRPSIAQRIFRRKAPFVLRENDVRRDVIRIQRYYERRGFDQVEVTHRIEEGRRDWQRYVTFEIDEGTPLRIRNLALEFESSDDSEQTIRESRQFERAMQRHDFQPGQRFRTVRTSDVEGLFIEAMQEAGFAYAEVRIEAEIDSLGREVDLTIHCITGLQQRFTNFEVIGDLSVDERLVIRETGIREDDLYSRSRMQRAQRELFNHHLFRFATISIPDQPNDSTLTLTMRVREYPQRSLQTQIGFGREELLRGQVTWLHRNVAGQGHRYSITGRGSFIEQRLGMEYLIPYVFNTRSSFVTSPYVQKRLEPAFELFRVGFSNSLIYQYSRNLTSSLSYELTYNEEMSRQQHAETALPDTILNFNTASIKLSAYYVTGLSRGQEGWVIQPFVEISSLFDEGTFEFQKTTLEVRRYTRLTNSLMIAKRVQGGKIFSASEDSLPSAIRFFTGGTNTVRGWSRQNLGPKSAYFGNDGRFDQYVPIGGRVLFNFNVELRQELNIVIPGLGVAAFLDGGQIWRSFDDLDQRPVQFGAGGGLRYESPIGPVRVDLGYKLNPMDEDLNIYQGEDYGSGLGRLGIHFSIGQAF